MCDNSEICSSELEVLEGIYADNLNISKPKYPQTFSISLLAHTAAKADVVMKCTLVFTFTPTYPDTAPKFDIKKTVKLNEDNKLRIMDIFKTVAERSTGCMMVFDIVSEIQEYLNTVAESWHEDVLQKAEERKVQKEKEEEAKFYGTRVTPESFARWREEFLAEMQQQMTAEELEEYERTKEAAKKPTGRELFLKDNRFDDSEFKFFEEDGGEVVEVDEKLFANLNIDDLTLSDAEFDEAD